MQTRSPSVIRLFTARTMVEAATSATDSIEPPQVTEAVMLPSSLDPGDELVRAMSRSLRSRGWMSSVRVPEHPLRSTARAIAGAKDAWRSVALQLPEGMTDEVSLPAGIVAAHSLMYVTLVDTVARTGPFQLDLLSRYVHPRHRLRRLIDRDRAQRAAEVNLARGSDWCVVGCTAPLGVVGVTTDVVAGELLALALAERFFGRQAEFASPWEDQVVQRATELELGARIPGDIRIELKDEPTVTEQAREVVDFLRQRMGIGLPDDA